MVISASTNPRSPDLGPSLGSSAEAFLGHLFLFGVLGVLVSYNICYARGRRQVLLGAGAALLVGLVWGAVTEGYQTQVAEREASSFDVMTDMLGAGLGGVSVAALYRLVRIPGLHT